MIVFPCTYNATVKIDKILQQFSVRYDNYDKNTKASAYKLEILYTFSS